VGEIIIKTRIKSTSDFLSLSVNSDRQPFSIIPIFIMTLFLLFAAPLFAQSDSGQSKAQKEAIIEQLKQSGMSDAEIQKQLENLQKSGQSPPSSDLDQSQLKSETAAETTAEIADEAKTEFDELSQLDEFEETEKEEIPIAGEAPSATGVLIIISPTKI